MMATRTEQIDAYLDGTLDEAGCADLEAALLGDPEVRDLFVARSRLNSRLRNQYAAARSAPVKPRPSVAVSAEGVPVYRKGHEPKSEFSNFKFSIFNLQFLSLAAALLIACGIGVYVFISSIPQPEVPDPTSTAPLATLIEASDGSTLTTPGGFISDGRDYPRGEYSLDRGTAEFMLTNSVNVKLRGETRMFMRNDMNVALTRGSAEFVCPPEASGFTVHLPDGSRIVDLGTAFTVRYDDATHRSIVYVTDGSVELHREGEVLTLAAGDGRAIDRDQPLRSLTGSELTSLGVSQPGLVAWWDFNTRSGDTITDVSGHNRIGRLRGTATLSVDAGGQSGDTDDRALVLDGTPGSELFVSADAFDEPPYDPLGGSFTVSTWVRVDGGGGIADHASTEGVQIAVGADGELNLVVGGRGARQGFDWNVLSVKPSAIAFDGRFHHVAIVVDRTDGSASIAVYIDGESKPYTNAFPGDWPASMGEVRFDEPLRFGVINGVSAFRGAIDDYALFDTALSPVQIASLASRTATPANLTGSAAPRPAPEPSSQPEIRE